MQPVLAESFLSSPRWTTLSQPAQCALQGILQFATRKHCDWIVDGSPKQIADWVGPEVRMAPTAIINGLRELAAAGVVKRGHRGPSGETVFIVAAPLVDRNTPAPKGVQERACVEAELKPVPKIKVKVKAPTKRKPSAAKRVVAVAARR
jgi:hypothetical protein